MQGGDIHARLVICLHNIKKQDSSIERVVMVSQLQIYILAGKMQRLISVDLIYNIYQIPLLSHNIPFSRLLQTLCVKHTHIYTK